MAENTNIEWTDASWNPVRGCTRVSEGCRNCYAEGVAARFSGEGLPYEGLAKRTPNGPRWTGKIQLVEDALGLPLRWKKPRKIFVNSMSDLFHPDVPFDFIDKVFAVMALAQRHTFQILTKRPERMREYFGQDHQSDVIDAWVRIAPMRANSRPLKWPLPNVWLGTSVENQQAADERIPELLKVPAVMRFLSCEPLLGPIEFSDVTRRADCVAMLGKPALTGISWVIVGGESGSGARSCDLAWIRSLVRQCRAVDVPCFVKQLGAQPTLDYYCEDDGLREWALDGFYSLSDWDESSGQPPTGTKITVKLDDRKGADMDEFPEDLRVREFPAAAEVAV